MFLRTLIVGPDLTISGRSEQSRARFAVVVSVDGGIVGIKRERTDDGVGARPRDAGGRVPPPAAGDRHERVRNTENGR